MYTILYSILYCLEAIPVESRQLKSPTPLFSNYHLISFFFILSTTHDSNKLLLRGPWKVQGPLARANFACWVHPIPLLAAHCKSAAQVTFEFGQTTHTKMVTVLADMPAGLVFQIPLEVFIFKIENLPDRPKQNRYTEICWELKMAGVLSTTPLTESGRVWATHGVLISLLKISG